MAASVIIGDIVYEVYEFDGTEESSGFTASIFIIDHTQSAHKSLLHMSASLTFAERRWNGVIHSQQHLGHNPHGQPMHKLMLCSTLHLHSQARQYAVFENKNLRYVLETILGNIKCQYLSKDHLVRYWMQYNESALDVINRLCFYYNLMYFCDNDKMTFIDHVNHMDLDAMEMYVNNAANDLNISALQHWNEMQSIHTKHKIYGFNDGSIVRNNDRGDGIIYDSNIQSQDMLDSYANSSHNNTLAQHRTEYSAESTNYNLRIGNRYKIHIHSTQPDIFYPIRIHHTYHNTHYTNKCVFLHHSQKHINKFHEAYATFMMATVVENDEPHKRDEIQVRFDWQNQHNTAYMPIMSMSAGDQYGAMFTPRPGHRVVIGFMAGNPNKPFVTGSMYQFGNHPAHADHDQYSYIRTQSFSTDVSNASHSDSANNKYNEIGFCDTHNDEHIKIHSCKDVAIHADNDISINAARDVNINTAHDVNQHTHGDANMKINGALNIELVPESDNSHDNISSNHNKDARDIHKHIHISNKHGGMRVYLSSAMQYSISDNCKIHVDEGGIECVVTRGAIRIKAPEIIIDADSTRINSNDINIHAQQSIDINGTDININGHGIKIQGDSIELN